MGTKSYTGGCSDIVNFRILPDGSLQKRSGYRKLCSLSEKIRAVWAGKLDGIYSLFALAGQNIYFIAPDSGTASKISTIADSKKHAEFFYYQGSLFLIDGNEIYTVTRDQVRVAVGYAPLIGKDWREEEIGEANEPRNVLTRRARISYLIEKSTATMLYTDGAVSSVDAVYINGAPITSDRYMLSSTPGIVIVTGLKATDRVELYITYEAGLSSSSVKSNTRAAVFGGINNSRPFLFGGAEQSVMYCGAFVSSSAMADCRRVYSDSDSAYFPKSHYFTVGDGKHPVCAVGRHFDRLLIFTEGGVWMADSSACGTEDFPVMNINTSVAVVSHGAIATMGNSPCAVGKDGVYAYSANTDELDECNAYSVSDAIYPLLSKQALENGGLYHKKDTGEILLYCGTSDEVWSYSIAAAQWTRYTGIRADVFFDLDEKAAFVQGNSVFVLENGLTADDGGKEICAAVATHPFAFSSSRHKSLSHAKAEFCGGSICEQLFFDEEEALGTEVTFTATGSQEQIQKKRIRAKRFKSVTVKLLANTDGLQRIISASLVTK